MTTNPFEVPGADTLDQPLRPWREGFRHADYFVAVDGMADQVRVFRTHLRDLTQARELGRLIIVGGEDGSGRSTLLHQCVAQLAPAPHPDPPAAAPPVAPVPTLPTAKIIDLTAFPVQQTAGVSERMMAVRTSLSMEFANRIRLPPEIISALQSAEKPQEAYQRLSMWLKGEYAKNPEQDIVLLLLLPTTDLEAEVVTYSECAFPRLVFFLEHSCRDRDLEQSMGRTQPGGLVKLRTGSLKEGDSWSFAQNRLELHDGSGEIPTMGEAVMTELSRDRKQLTLKELQVMLRDIYRQRIETGRTGDAVTYTDVARYFVQHGRL